MRDRQSRHRDGGGVVRGRVLAEELAHEGGDDHRVPRIPLLGDHLQRLGELDGRCEPLFAVPRQRPEDDPLERLGALRVQLADRLGPFFGALEVLPKRSALEGWTAGEQLVEDRPHCEQVRSRIHLPDAELFGRHVGELPLHHARRRVARVPRDLRDAEVGHLHVPVESDQDVFRAHVAVDDPQGLSAVVAEGVGMVESAEGLGAHGRGECGDHPAPRLHHRSPDPAQAVAVHVLHRDEVRALVLTQLEDLHEVRVREQGRHPRLVQEHLDRCVILGEEGQDPLHHHDLGEPSRASRHGKEDFAHSSGAQQVHQLVAPDPITAHLRPTIDQTADLRRKPPAHVGAPTAAAMQRGEAGRPAAGQAPASRRGGLREPCPDRRGPPRAGWRPHTAAHRWRRTTAARRRAARSRERP